MPFALRVRGALDVDALEEALRRLVGRHESLRTRFVARDGVPTMVVDPAPVARALDVDDLSALPVGVREVRVAERAEADALKAFGIERDALFRTRLLRLAADEHVLLLCLHHIVSDGWSAGIITRDLAALYAGAELRALAVGGPDVPPRRSERGAADRARAVHPSGRRRDRLRLLGTFRELLGRCSETVLGALAHQDDRGPGLPLLHTVKPLDTEAVYAEARTTRHIVTVEVSWAPVASAPPSPRPSPNGDWPAG